MVRFSCFNGHINSHKPKKIEQTSVEAMHKTSQDCTQNHASKILTIETCSSSSKVQGDIPTNGSGSRTSSIECSWKAEDIKGKIIEGALEVAKTSQLKKSQSLGSGLYLEDKISAENDIGSEVDQEFSCDGSHDHNEFAEGKEQGGSQPNLYEKDVTKDLKVGSEILNDGSTFSIDNATHSEKEDREISDALLSGEDAGESRYHSPRTPHMIVRFCSLPNIGASVAPYANLIRSRSFEDLHDWYMKRKGISDEHLEQKQTRCNDVSKTDKNNFENSFDGGYDSSHCSASTKEWIMPVLDELHAMKNLHDELSAPQESLNKDFRIKRIEEWVNALEHCSLIEEANELSQSSEQVKEHSMSNELTAAKLENKVTPGMEAAKRYISSLTANASTAQLANHGLVVIPFLSAFVSLRVLNLSGNAIVRITSGALPRGLHTLNLSKNNISYIEGLRELTRLRVLDLSYNRILRIGHGLASCSSLKELYLAGNKISEVEGLHRLLKLTVLDLRFNKISTAKCLGQLAANYISLQAISLEGNPAQKNVGDEQLKKHLQGLLPQLVYYNRQAIKVSSLKDVADRSVRLNMSSHQLDRGLRLDHKGTRKGSQRPSSSFSVHSRGSQASVVSQKHSRGRHMRFPPGKTTATTRLHYLDSGSKALNLKAEHSIRRSRSEGNFGAL